MRNIAIVEDQDNAAQRLAGYIDKYAAEGWRYVGFFPVSFTGHGGISMVDLIFEREV